MTWLLGDAKFLFSCWKKYFTHLLHSLVKYFSLEEKLCISARPCNILYFSRKFYIFSLLNCIFLLQICVVKERLIQRSDLPPLVVEIGLLFSVFLFISICRFKRWANSKSCLNVYFSVARFKTDYYISGIAYLKSDLVSRAHFVTLTFWFPTLFLFFVNFISM